MQVRRWKVTRKRQIHPGRILKERFLDPLGITPYRLAKSIGVHVRRVSEIVNGRRSITPDTAIRLGLFFDVPPTWWLEMQARYDTLGVPLVDELRERVTAYEGLARVLISPDGARLLDGPKEPELSTLLVRVPDNLLERLRAQIALQPRRRHRQVLTVTHANGATALVGGEK